MNQKINKQIFKKFVNNQCTPEEIEEVIEYFQSIKSTNDLPTLESVLSLLNESPKISSTTSEKMLQNIQSKTKNPVGKVRFLWKYVAVAAVFIAFINVGYFFYQRDTNKNNLQAENAITLEMGNGKIQILREGKDITIKNTNGEVIGKQKNGQLAYSQENTNNSTHNTLKVPYGKRYKMILSDGTSVVLNSGSSLRYPVTFNKYSDREVFLSGEAFFKVSKDTKRPFMVHTDFVNVEVLGTEFNVSSYPEDRVSSVVLVEGSVALDSKNNPQTKTLLNPGFKGTLDKKLKFITTSKVDTQTYIAWINGRLAFNNIKFEHLLKKLERHYNVNINCNDSILNSSVFNANFGNEPPLSTILKNLKTVYGIHYSYKEDKVIIYSKN